DDVALGVDGLAGRRRDAADEGDLAALDPDVGAVRRQAGAVDHHAVLDHEIVAHRGGPPAGGCAMVARPARPPPARARHGAMPWSRGALRRRAYPPPRPSPSRQGYRI